MLKKKDARTEKRNREYSGLAGIFCGVVTVLLCFFVLLYAASSPDEQKFQYIMNAFAGNDKTAAPYKSGGVDTENVSGGGGLDGFDFFGKVENFDELFYSAVYIAENSDTAESVSVSESVEYGMRLMHIRFDDGIMFSRDSAALLDTGKKALMMFRPCIAAAKPYIRQIAVSGHTAQGYSAVSDWQLSAARAAGVTDFMTSRDFVETAKYIVVGRGPYSPVYERAGDSTEAYKNRRIELTVYTVFAEGG